MRRPEFAKPVAATVARPIVASVQKPTPAIGHLGLPFPEVLAGVIGFAFPLLLARADEVIE